MIRVEHLAKRYGSTVVLKDINTEIRKGEVVSIIGPSGTGKSTFLRCLNLLEQPTSGTIEIDGQDVLAPGADVPKLRQRMNMVFQSFNLFAHLTVLENLTLAPIKLKGMTPAAAQTKCMDLLRLVGLAERAHFLPEQLSGGQKPLRAALPWIRKSSCSTNPPQRSTPPWSAKYSPSSASWHAMA
jgi:polar amino acid transport system ATP-binding protein